MSTTDYVVDILLIVVIFRQLRERPYTLRTTILPIGIMVWAGFHYLRGFDIAGNDLVLITLLALSGLALGAASGATTFMWLDESRAYSAVLVSTPASPGSSAWVLALHSPFTRVHQGVAPGSPSSPAITPSQGARPGPPPSSPWRLLRC